MKKVPAVMAMVEVKKAPAIASAEGKVAMMRRIRELTNEGEDIAMTLVRILKGDGSTNQVLDAAKILLSYGWGKPIETQVTANMTPNVEGGVSRLTNEQLEDVVNARLLPAGDEGED